MKGSLSLSPSLPPSFHLFGINIPVNFRLIKQHFHVGSRAYFLFPSVLFFKLELSAINIYRFLNQIQIPLKKWSH